MKNYPHNSPEAMARIVVMCMLADSDIDPSELDSLEGVQLYGVLGLGRAEFLQLFRDHMATLADESGHSGRVRMLDPARINHALSEVTERNLRITTLATALNICKADHALNDAELALFRHIMQEWQLDLTDLEIEVINPM